MMLAASTGMNLPELASGDPLRQVVAAVIRKRRGPAPSDAGSHAHWDAAFFGLDRVTAFNAAPQPIQQLILERCGRDLLSEAFYIEKFGVAFAAKMVLLAQSIDERKLYALFGADEAIHLDRVACCYGERADEPTANPFLALLSELIESGDRSSLQVIIQVVLEGWGLSHYRAMRDACRSAPLREILTSILADEAAHHGSGVVLIGDRALGPASTDFILETMTRFLALVQAGPLGVYAAVTELRGPLPQLERQRLWSELEPERSSRERLEQLRQLMGKCPALAGITERLTLAASFEPRCNNLEPA